MIVLVLIEIMHITSDADKYNEFHSFQMGPCCNWYNNRISYLRLTITTNGSSCNGNSFGITLHLCRYTLLTHALLPVTPVWLTRRVRLNYDIRKN